MRELPVPFRGLKLNLAHLCSSLSSAKSWPPEENQETSASDYHKLHDDLHSSEWTLKPKSRKRRRRRAGAMCRFLMTISIHLFIVAILASKTNVINGSQETTKDRRAILLAGNATSSLYGSRTNSSKAEPSQELTQEQQRRLQVEGQPVESSGGGSKVFEKADSKESFKRQSAAAAAEENNNAAQRDDNNSSLSAAAALAKEPMRHPLLNRLDLFERAGKNGALKEAHLRADSASLLRSKQQVFAASNASNRPRSPVNGLGVGPDDYEDDHNGNNLQLRRPAASSRWSLPAPADPQNHTSLPEDVLRRREDSQASVPQQPEAPQPDDSSELVGAHNFLQFGAELAQDASRQPPRQSLGPRNLNASLEAQAKLKDTMNQLHYNKTLALIADRDKELAGSASVDEQSSLLESAPTSSSALSFESMAPISVSPVPVQFRPVEYLNAPRVRPPADLLEAAGELHQRRHSKSRAEESDTEASRERQSWGRRKSAVELTEPANRAGKPTATYEDIVTWTPTAGPAAYLAGSGYQIDSQDSEASSNGSRRFQQHSQSNKGAYENFPRFSEASSDFGEPSERKNKHFLDPAADYATNESNLTESFAPSQPARDRESHKLAKSSPKSRHNNLKAATPSSSTDEGGSEESGFEPSEGSVAILSGGQKGAKDHDEGRAGESEDGDEEEEQEEQETTTGRPKTRAKFSAHGSTGGWPEAVEESQNGRVESKGRAKVEVALQNSIEPTSWSPADTSKLAEAAAKSQTKEEEIAGVSRSLTGKANFRSKPQKGYHLSSSVQNSKPPVIKTFRVADEEMVDEQRRRLNATPSQFSPPGIFRLGPPASVRAQFGAAPVQRQQYSWPQPVGGFSPQSSLPGSLNQRAVRSQNQANQKQPSYEQSSPARDANSQQPLRVAESSPSGNSQPAGWTRIPVGEPERSSAEGRTSWSVASAPPSMPTRAESPSFLSAYPPATRTNALPGTPQEQVGNRMEASGSKWHHPQDSTALGVPDRRIPFKPGNANQEIVQPGAQATGRPSQNPDYITINLNTHAALPAPRQLFWEAGAREIAMAEKLASGRVPVSNGHLPPQHRETGQQLPMMRRPFAPLRPFLGPGGALQDSSMAASHTNGHAYPAQMPKRNYPQLALQGFQELAQLQAYNQPQQGLSYLEGGAPEALGYLPLQMAGAEEALGGFMSSPAMQASSFVAPQVAAESFEHLKSPTSGLEVVPQSSQLLKKGSVISAVLPYATPTAVRDPFGWPMGFGSQAAKTLLKVNHVAPPPSFLVPPEKQASIIISSNAEQQAGEQQPFSQWPASAPEQLPASDLFGQHSMLQPQVAVWPGGALKPGHLGPEANLVHVQLSTRPPNANRLNSRAFKFWQRLRDPILRISGRFNSSENPAQQKRFRRSLVQTVGGYLGRLRPKFNRSLSVMASSESQAKPQVLPPPPQAQLEAGKLAMLSEETAGGTRAAFIPLLDTSGLEDADILQQALMFNGQAPLDLQDDPKWTQLEAAPSTRVVSHLQPQMPHQHHQKPLDGYHQLLGASQEYSLAANMEAMASEQDSVSLLPPANAPGNVALLKQRDAQPAYSGLNSRERLKKLSRSFRKPLSRFMGLRAAPANESSRPPQPERTAGPASLQASELTSISQHLNNVVSPSVMIAPNSVQSFENFNRLTLPIQHWYQRFQQQQVTAVPQQASPLPLFPLANHHSQAFSPYSLITSPEQTPRPLVLHSEPAPQRDSLAASGSAPNVTFAEPSEKYESSLIIDQLLRQLQLLAQGQRIERSLVMSPLQRAISELKFRHNLEKLRENPAAYKLISYLRPASGQHLQATKLHTSPSQQLSNLTWPTQTALQAAKAPAGLVSVKRTSSLLDHRHQVFPQRPPLELVSSRPEVRFMAGEANSGIHLKPSGLRFLSHPRESKQMLQFSLSPSSLAPETFQSAPSKGQLKQQVKLRYSPEVAAGNLTRVLEAAPDIYSASSNQHPMEIVSDLGKLNSDEIGQAQVIEDTSGLNSMLNPAGGTFNNIDVRPGSFREPAPSRSQPIRQLSHQGGQGSGSAAEFSLTQQQFPQQEAFGLSPATFGASSLQPVRPRLPKLIPSINSMASKFRQHLYQTFKMNPMTNKWPNVIGSASFMSYPKYQHFQQPLGASSSPNQLVMQLPAAANQADRQYAGLQHQQPQVAESNFYSFGDKEHLKEPFYEQQPFNVHSSAVDGSSLAGLNELGEDIGQPEAPQEPIVYSDKPREELGGANLTASVVEELPPREPDQQRPYEQQAREPERGSPRASRPQQAHAGAARNKTSAMRDVPNNLVTSDGSYIQEEVVESSGPQEAAAEQPESSGTSGPAAQKYEREQTSPKSAEVQYQRSRPEATNFTIHHHHVIASEAAQKLESPSAEAGEPEQTVVEQPEAQANQTKLAASVGSSAMEIRHEEAGLRFQQLARLPAKPKRLNLTTGSSQRLTYAPKLYQKRPAKQKVLLASVQPEEPQKVDYQVIKAARPVGGQELPENLQEQIFVQLSNGTLVASGKEDQREPQEVSVEPVQMSSSGGGEEPTEEEQQQMAGQQVFERESGGVIYAEEPQGQTQLLYVPEERPVLVKQLVSSVGGAQQNGRQQSPAQELQYDFRPVELAGSGRQAEEEAVGEQAEGEQTVSVGSSLEFGAKTRPASDGGEIGQPGDGRQLALFHNQQQEPAETGSSISSNQQQYMVVDQPVVLSGGQPNRTLLEMVQPVVFVSAKPERVVQELAPHRRLRPAKLTKATSGRVQQLQVQFGDEQRASEQAATHSNASQPISTTSTTTSTSTTARPSSERLKSIYSLENIRNHNLKYTSTAAPAYAQPAREGSKRPLKSKIRWQGAAGNKLATNSSGISQQKSELSSSETSRNEQAAWIIGGMTHQSFANSAQADKSKFPEEPSPSSSESASEASQAKPDVQLDRHKFSNASSLATARPAAGNPAEQPKLMQNVRNRFRAFSANQTASRAPANHKPAEEAGQPASGNGTQSVRKDSRTASTSFRLSFSQLVAATSAPAQPAPTVPEEARPLPPGELLHRPTSFSDSSPLESVAANGTGSGAGATFSARSDAQQEPTEALAPSGTEQTPVSVLELGSAGELAPERRPSGQPEEAGGYQLEQHQQELSPADRLREELERAQQQRQEGEAAGGRTSIKLGPQEEPAKNYDTELISLLAGRHSGDD